MSLDPAWMFLSLVLSGIGFVLFRYGRKEDRWPQIVAGVALMLYPYAISLTWMLYVVGAALCVAIYMDRG